MTNLFRWSAGIAPLAIALVIALGPTTARAQGSAGGSIGNDDKAVSGSRSTTTREAPARRSRQTEEPPRRVPRRSGGGGGNFDGSWTVTASPGCAASGTGTVMVSGGRVSGQGISGTVSPNGATRTVGYIDSITIVSSGRVTGTTSSGVYRQSDGCSGTWRGMKN
ncbi:MAG: hypothetical protein JWR89_4442 [Tardiphaga sp.]|uniref:hypothetical protein n=1 Tax=Tardiphaga sp. TaxID=1926292 RepID=UPI002612ECE2|nr:hypothetical protein [Tardiphaga sp.]MDB5504540.1 hypothetical protein [Tardiphaga sp.]